ncbi:MAG: hypothetical protein H6Q60_1085 [Oscillospiraceae bacterium]|nr:hypothetical protein [Oscillospiraceae bacterium]
MLNEARENSEAMIDAMHIKGEMKPRTYRKRAHRDYLALVKNRKPTAKKIRKAIGKQLGYLARNLGHIERMLAAVKALLPRQLGRLAVIRKIYEQQKTMVQIQSDPWIFVLKWSAGLPT